MRYLDAKDKLPEYMPYPRFLLRMELSHTAKLIYILLLDRYTLSRKNNWKDEEGHIYVIFSIEHLMEALGRGGTVVKEYLIELEKAGLIRRKRSGLKKSLIYLMMPDETREVQSGIEWKNDNIHFENERRDNWKDWTTYAVEGLSGKAEKPESTENRKDSEESTENRKNSEESTEKRKNSEESTENRKNSEESTEKRKDSEESTEIPQECPENRTELSRKTGNCLSGKPSSNNIIHNNIISNNTHTAKECAYGVYGNVLLTEEEYGELQALSPDMFPAMLNFLSERIRNNEIPDDPHGVIMRRLLTV